MCMGVWLHVCVPLAGSFHGGQKRALSPVELILQMGVSCQAQTQVLSGWVAIALHHWIVSSAPCLSFLTSCKHKRKTECQQRQMISWGGKSLNPQMMFTTNHIEPNMGLHWVIQNTQNMKKRSGQKKWGVVIPQQPSTQACCHANVHDPSTREPCS